MDLCPSGIGQTTAWLPSPLVVGTLAALITHVLWPESQSPHLKSKHHPHSLGLSIPAGVSVTCGCVFLPPLHTGRLLPTMWYRPHPPDSLLSSSRAPGWFLWPGQNSFLCSPHCPPASWANTCVVCFGELARTHWPVLIRAPTLYARPLILVIWLSSSRGEPHSLLFQGRR